MIRILSGIKRRSPGTTSCAFLVFAALTAAPWAHPAISEDDGKPLSFESNRWKFLARESRIVEHLGRPSLFLDGGLALLEDAEFLDGTLEFDLSFSGKRGFVGAVFRVQDPQNFEQFYLRPHQSGNPDANQYTPVFHGVAGWQLYHGPGYGAAVTYPTNEWISVRIVVSGTKAAVYIGDQSKPSVLIPELKRGASLGGVGLCSGGGYAPAHFSNFRVRKTHDPLPFPGRMRRAKKTPPGTVKRYLVSSSFPAKDLDGKTSLPSEETISNWTPLPSELPSGITNLARIQGIGEGRNTVFAKFEIESTKNQTKPMSFGFSDRLRIYVNRRLIYQGDNTYRTRDYRYLGTIGFFDQVYLPLEQGVNEVRFAVTEGFGGWGVMSRLEDLSEISISAQD